MTCPSQPQQGYSRRYFKDVEQVVMPVPAGPGGQKHPMEFLNGGVGHRGSRKCWQPGQADT